MLRVWRSRYRRVLHEAPRLMLSHLSGAWLEAGQIRHSAACVHLGAGASLDNALRLAAL